MKSAFWWRVGLRQDISAEVGQGKKVYEKAIFKSYRKRRAFKEQVPDTKFQNPGWSENIYKRKQTIGVQVS